MTILPSNNEILCYRSLCVIDHLSYGLVFFWRRDLVAGRCDHTSRPRFNEPTRPPRKHTVGREISLSRRRRRTRPRMGIYADQISSALFTWDVALISRASKFRFLPSAFVDVQLVLGILIKLRQLHRFQHILVQCAHSHLFINEIPISPQVWSTYYLIDSLDGKNSNQVTRGQCI